MANTPAPRARTRGAAAKGDAGPGANIRSVLEPLAASYYIENKASNAHKRTADAARKKLRGQMAELMDDKPFQFTMQTAEGPLAVNVTVDTPDKEVIDARALYKIMECDRDPKEREKFLEMCSVTIKSVEEHLGKIIATRVRKTVQGETNVNVRPVEPKA